MISHINLQDSIQCVRVRWTNSMTCLVPVIPHCYLCCLLSPHFPALPRTSPDWVPRTSPHFLGFLWIGRLGRDQDVVFIWFLLQKIGKDSASPTEIIKNTELLASKNPCALRTNSKFSQLKTRTIVFSIPRDVTNQEQTFILPGNV